MKRFCSKYDIRADVSWADENPNFDSDNKHGVRFHHFKVVLKRGSPRRQLTVLFSQGEGICREPEAVDVLNCLVSDAQTIENARSFEEWASELGFETDSRKAERSYKQCVAQTEKLERFLGDDYEHALYRTEGL